MDIQVESFIENFGGFLSSIEDFDSGQIFSYAFKINNADPTECITKFTDEFKTVFFFNNQSANNLLLAVNTISNYPDSKNSKFKFVEESFYNWQSQLTTNWENLNLKNPPIICCAIKFDNRDSSEEWKSFPVISFYIPQFMLVNLNGKTLGIYNFIIDRDEDLIKAKLTDYLCLVFSTKQNKTSSKTKYANKLLLNGNKENDAWEKTLRRAKRILVDKKAEKLVLSRRVQFVIDDKPDWERIFDELSNRFPECQVFLYKIDDSSFFGVSPERLIKAQDGKIELEAVAGSAPRGEKNVDDENFENGSLQSKKNKAEHKFVSDFIHKIVKEHAEEISISKGTQTLKLDNIQHLITKISAQLRNNNDIFHLIDKLFPTPAVCGVPQKIALEEISKLETHDRGLYSGLIGWMDFAGNCEFAVAIRSALHNKNSVKAYAGAGILEDSDPEDEFLETQLKLEPILSLFMPKD